MKRGLYRRLAAQGILKNRRLYTPYLLTCMGMVMMHYITGYLGCTDAIANMKGRRVFSEMMVMGGYILGIFSAVFLFYTNSFLIRRRKKEFGLYNMLGMNKGGIAKVLLWESLMTAALSLAGGLLLGAVLSKLFELVMLYIAGEAVNFRFTVSLQAVGSTVMWFLPIFLAIFISSLVQVRKASPVALLRSESAGEKPPKANWFAGLLGAALLAAAYTLSLTIEDPMAALGRFCIAVILVILATYLLFTAGSVLLCRLLQKNKRYYYKANHFVSVSSMAYRMKRNGAGLASICILVTMVLVTLSSTASLYVGAEDSFQIRCPNDFHLQVFFEDRESWAGQTAGEVFSVLDSTLDAHGISREAETRYPYAKIYGRWEDGTVRTHVPYGEQNVLLYFLDIREHDRLSGTHTDLAPGEALLYAPGFTGTQITFPGKAQWQVKQHLTEFPIGNDDISRQTVYLAVPDLQNVLSLLYEDQPYGSVFQYCWSVVFDTEADSETQISGEQAVIDALQAIQTDENGQSRYHFYLDCAAAIRDEYFATYGSLFYLGLLLSAVFLCAAVLIIYYKQISEGYEDQARFVIMRKVGMTKAAIRKTINSQMLTVLFLPLLLSGAHLCFAFPLLEKMLMMFNLTNRSLILLTTASGFLLFSAVYALVYRLTSNAYYCIVSSNT